MQIHCITETRSDRRNWALVTFERDGEIIEQREFTTAEEGNLYAPYGNYALKLAHDWADLRWPELTASNA